MKKKLPAFTFYPGDWLRDRVAGCSLAAQGLWLRLMILAHDSERYGHLCQNGSPIPPEQLARHCGCSLVEFEGLLTELESAGVPSRTRDGIIFSRRMVRDAEDRKQAALRKQEQRERDEHQQRERKSHADVTPSSRESHTSSSSSVSVKKERKTPPTPSGGNRKREPNADVEPYYGEFQAAYLSAYRGAPYSDQPADFVQLSKLRSTWEPDRLRGAWARALGNYFASPLGKHTLAHLCAEFARFQTSALDRYNKPVESKSMSGGSSGYGSKTFSGLP